MITSVVLVVKRDSSARARQRAWRWLRTGDSAAQRAVSSWGMLLRKRRLADRSQQSGKGDSISIDIEQRKIDFEVTVDVLHERLSKLERPIPKYTTGVMAKYAALVGSASEGAVTSRPGL